MKAITNHLWIISFLVASALLSLKFGASDLTGEEILDLRLPRVILAFGVGAALSLSGAILQALFTNPLCEPYTLGISSGSALGAVMGATLGWGVNAYGFSPASFLGGIIFALILYFFSSRHSMSKTALLLAGVMLSFVGSSLVAVWMALADPAGIQGALVWLLGDLSRARFDGSIILVGIVIVITGRLIYTARGYDALLMGEETALSVGVNLQNLRREAILLSSILTGLSVSAAGMIGFIGLLIPHVVRKTNGSLHRSVFPIAVFMGGGTLIFSDLLARIVARPYELPVGVVTSLIGAPVFLMFMLRSGVKK